MEIYYPEYMNASCPAVQFGGWWRSITQNIWMQVVQQSSVGVDGDLFHNPTLDCWTTRIHIFCVRDLQTSTLDCWTTRIHIFCVRDLHQPPNCTAGQLAFIYSVKEIYINPTLDCWTTRIHIFCARDHQTPTLNCWTTRIHIFCVRDLQTPTLDCWTTRIHIFCVRDLHQPPNCTAGQLAFIYSVKEKR